MNALTETEREMVAVERVHQYVTEIQCESQKSALQPAPYAWPSQGVVQFQNVILKYRYVQVLLLFHFFLCIALL